MWLLIGRGLCIRGGIVIRIRSRQDNEENRYSSKYKSVFPSNGVKVAWIGNRADNIVVTLCESLDSYEFVKKQDMIVIYKKELSSEDLMETYGKDYDDYIASKIAEEREG